MGEKLIPAFCLTAGLGSRLAPHTQVRAKPCLPFLGAPLFAFSYYLCTRGGFKNFFFNLHHLPNQVQGTIQKTLPFNSSAKFFDESQKLLGSGGALWNAKSELKKYPYFLVANGDEVLIPQDPQVLEKLENQFNKRPVLATLLVTDHPELLKTLRPVWVNRQHEVIGFGMDRPNDEALPVHYTGFKIISTKIFNYLKPGESNIFYDGIVDAIANGETVTTHHCNQMSWYETGKFPAFIHALTQTLELLEKDNSYLLALLKHFGFNPREWVYESNKDHKLFHHRDTFVPRNLTLKGTVYLGKGVKVGIKGTLENVVAEDSSVIADHANLSNTFVFQTP